MELNSLLILLEAAEYLERRDRGISGDYFCEWKMTVTASLSLCLMLRFDVPCHSAGMMSLQAQWDTNRAMGANCIPTAASKFYLAYATRQLL